MRNVVVRRLAVLGGIAAAAGERCGGASSQPDPTGQPDLQVTTP